MGVVSLHQGNYVLFFKNIYTNLCNVMGGDIYPEDALGCGEGADDRCGTKIFLIMRCKCCAESCSDSSVHCGEASAGEANLYFPPQEGLVWVQQNNPQRA